MELEDSVPPKNNSNKQNSEKWKINYKREKLFIGSAPPAANFMTAAVKFFRVPSFFFYSYIVSIYPINLAFWRGFF